MFGPTLGPRSRACAVRGARARPSKVRVIYRACNLPTSTYSFTVFPLNRRNVRPSFQVSQKSDAFRRSESVSGVSEQRTKSLHPLLRLLFLCLSSSPARCSQDVVVPTQFRNRPNQQSQLQFILHLTAVTVISAFASRACLQSKNWLPHERTTLGSRVGVRPCGIWRLVHLQWQLDRYSPGAGSWPRLLYCVDNFRKCSTHTLHTCYRSRRAADGHRCRRGSHQQDH